MNCFRAAHQNGEFYKVFEESVQHLHNAIPTVLIRQVLLNRSDLKEAISFVVIVIMIVHANSCL